VPEELELLPGRVMPPPTNATITPDSIPSFTANTDVMFEDATKLVNEAFRNPVDVAFLFRFFLQWDRMTHHQSRFNDMRTLMLVDESLTEAFGDSEAVQAVLAEGGKALNEGATPSTTPLLAALYLRYSAEEIKAYLYRLATREVITTLDRLIEQIYGRSGFIPARDELAQLPTFAQVLQQTMRTSPEETLRIVEEIRAEIGVEYIDQIELMKRELSSL